MSTEPRAKRHKAAPSKAAPSKAAPSKAAPPVCPLLPDFERGNLTAQQIEHHLNLPEIVFLFKKKCTKKQNESYNKWREHLFVKIFNMISIPNDSTKHDWTQSRLSGGFAKQWLATFNQLRDLEKDMLIYENIINHEGAFITPGNPIIETKLNLLAGQGNYDFDYVIKFNQGPEQVFHYEYKNHIPEKLPQLLSLYDVVNPLGEQITDGKKKGHFKKFYQCAMASYFDPAKERIPFEFWHNHGFWKWHLTDAVNGIPKIREELAAIGVVLPIITELDYFCHVKKTAIPGRWGTYSPKWKADTIEELDALTTAEPAFPNAKRLNNHIKWVKPWHKYGAKKYPSDPYKVLRFFQILFDNKGKIKNISNCQSMKNYLTAFKSNKVARNSLMDRVYENIRMREGNKRFIFYYPCQSTWRMSKPYAESFEKKNVGEIITITTNTKTPHLRIATKSNNSLDFNLRWINTKGLQNPGWQMNIHKGNTTKKLFPEVIRGNEKKATVVSAAGGAASASAAIGGNRRKSRKRRRRNGRKSRKRNGRKSRTKH